LFSGLKSKSSPILPWQNPCSRTISNELFGGALSGFPSTSKD
jgi:hypothetical protein